jgi:hypothetical protein
VGVGFYPAHREIDARCSTIRTASLRANGVATPSTEAAMELLLIIIVVVLLFGGGGYWGRRRGHW